MGNSLANFNPMLMEHGSDNLLCKKCKFAGKSVISPYCQKFKLDDLKMKPNSVMYAVGEGTCPEFELETKKEGKKKKV